MIGTSDMKELTYFVIRFVVAAGKYTFKLLNKNNKPKANNGPM